MKSGRGGGPSPAADPGDSAVPFFPLLLWGWVGSSLAVAVEVRGPHHALHLGRTHAQVCVCVTCLCVSHVCVEGIMVEGIMPSTWAGRTHTLALLI